MSIRKVEIDASLPEGWRGLTLHGLPGHPKTVAGLEGRDVVTGEVWRASVYPDPANPTDSIMVLVPNSVPFVRVVSADEWLEELTADFFDEMPTLRA